MNNSVSLVIPICNEQDNVKPLIKQLVKALKPLSLKSFEVIFIDDGSFDQTYPKLCQLKKLYSFIKIIKFKKNFGKATAYSIGFSHARNDIIITLDGDLQDDPADISNFLNSINDGYDLVVGWKTSGKGTWRKTLISRIFNQITAWTFKLQLHDIDCPFKAYRRSVIKGLNIYSGLYRFIPIFANNYGFKVTEIKINNRPRLVGRSKFGGKRLVSGFLDFLTVFFITRFNLNPMHFFGSLALTCLSIGTVILSYLTVLSFQGEKVGSRPLFQLGLLLEIMSLQFFSIGFIGEMLTRNLIRIDPDYIIDEIKDS